MSFQPLPVKPSPLPDKSDSLTILPLTDLHLPQLSQQDETIPANRALLERVDHVVFMGDMVRCYGTDREYGRVRTFVKELDKPFNAVSGNHEWYFEEFHEDSGLYGEVWAESAPDEGRALLAKFQRFWHEPHLWHAQSHPLGHFVFLSLDDIGNSKQEALSRAQLEFLSHEVERAGERPLFLFCHTPVMLEKRLDLVYYDRSRSACVELKGQLLQQFLQRETPSFWMSGHIHLHPDHYLFPPYKSGGNLWQIHCPDSWGYGRWKREQQVPKRYNGVFSRMVQIDGQGVSFITHDHLQRCDIASFRVDF